MLWIVAWWVWSLTFVWVALVGILRWTIAGLPWAQ